MNPSTELRKNRAGTGSAPHQLHSRRLIRDLETKKYGEPSSRPAFPRPNGYCTSAHPRPSASTSA